MQELISDLFIGLMHWLGISVEESSERTQALALFAFCGLFGVVAGFCSSGLAGSLWFVVGGFGGLAVLVVTFWKSE